MDPIVIRDWMGMAGVVLVVAFGLVKHVVSRAKRNRRPGPPASR